MMFMMSNWAVGCFEGGCPLPFGSVVVAMGGGEGRGVSCLPNPVGRKTRVWLFSLDRQPKQIPRFMHTFVLAVVSNEMWGVSMVD